MKSTIDERKKQIQNQLVEELQILEDVPKQGFGSSNDGNTARLFFNNADTVANITVKINYCLNYDVN